MELDKPKVMGILNVTPDSFYGASRTSEEDLIRERVRQIVDEGADIIDIGGCSSRPGFEAPSEQEEMDRVAKGFQILRDEYPDFPLSVDTFRASVAAMAIKDWNVAIINDISGGEDPEMWSLVAKEHRAYVLTHNRKENAEYSDVTAEVIKELSRKANEILRLGVCDLIIDPGFGFAKGIEDNFRLLEELNEIKRMGFPVLVGISRKSMIYRSLGITPEESLTGTVALDAIALEKGADILRVHDVKEAVETVRLFNLLKKA